MKYLITLFLLINSANATDLSGKWNVYIDSSVGYVLSLMYNLNNKVEISFTKDKVYVTGKDVEYFYKVKKNKLLLSRTKNSCEIKVINLKKIDNNCMVAKLDSIAIDSFYGEKEFKICKV